MGGLAGAATGQLILFSFWRRLQNQTLTTSFSMDNCSAIMEISSELGLGFFRDKGIGCGQETVVQAQELEVRVRRSKHKELNIWGQRS